MKKFFANWGGVIGAGVGILIVGLVPRLINLTLLPIFADEAIYIRWAQIMVNEPTLRFLPLSDGKQPLFMWILMFAVRRFSDPLFVGRLLSVFSGLGAMLGIFLLTYLLFKNRVVSLVAVFIYALSPFSFFFDRMALVDSLLSMWGVWTLVLGVATAKTGRLDLAMLTGFALGFASLTKSSALFFALILPGTWIFVDWPVSWKQRLARVLQLSGLLLVTLVIALAMYNIQRLGPNFQMLTSRTADYVFPLSHLWTNPRDPFIPLFHRSFEWFWIMGPWPLLVLVIIGLLAQGKKQWKEIGFLLFAWGFPTVFQSMFAKVYTARYELFTIPYLFILAALSAAPGKDKLGKILKYLFFLGLALFVFLAARFNYLLLTDPEKADLPRGERSGYLEEWTAGTGITEVAGIVKAEHAKNPERQIVVGTEGYFGTLPDGLQIYLEGIPKVTVIGVGLDLGEVPSELVNSVRAGDRTYLVINSSRLKIKKESFAAKGLKLIAQYPKAQRPDGYKEYVQFGPRDYLYLFEVGDRVF